MRCAATGAVLWFVAAMMIRGLGPLGALTASFAPWTFALIVPGTVPVVLLMRRAGGVQTCQTAMAMAIGTAVATLLDGAALTCMPALYGADPAAAGRVILWGAGVGMMLGFVMNRKQARGQGHVIP